MTHTYICETHDGRTRYIMDRRTKPRIGMVITAYGSKFQVWYIEDRPNGAQAARCEPFKGQK